MLGLGAYASDSEDEELPSKQQQQHPNNESISASEAKPAGPIAEINQEAQSQAVADKSKPLVGPFQPSDSRPLSPADNATSPSRKLSPFSANRTLIHDMTLPPVPSLDIPPSPPGSPNPAANQKFAHFLSLKRQGVHFNEKLAGSSSLKNPSLLPKLMSHAGIDEQAQYATSLPTDLWDVSALPSWGYKEELNKSQQEIRRKIEEKKASGQREVIDFVSGGASGESSRTGTPSSGKMRSSAAERVMAGLNGDKTDSPISSDQGRRPRRKRSRSR